MRRLSVAFGVVVLLALMALPVAAARPSGGCGAEASGWEVVTYAEWLEATEEAIGGELTAGEEAEISGKPCRRRLQQRRPGVHEGVLPERYHASLPSRLLQLQGQHGSVRDIVPSSPVISRQ